MANNYKEIKQLGKGAFSKVVLIQKNKKIYALKKIFIKQLGKEEINNFKNEVKILSGFNSAYIVKYYDSFITKDYLNIKMEYCGDNLKSFIKGYKDKGELIEENIIKNIISQICFRLKIIHEAKIIHRDLKPENIFISKNYTIKIGDFGVSKILDSYHQYAQSMAGTFHYNAPEIEKGEKYDFRADIYSFGCIIYELFTLNEYYIDKLDDKNCKINFLYYEKEWQNLIDSFLQKDYHKRPFIEEAAKNIQKIEKIFASRDDFTNFIIHQIKRIKELYEGEILLDNILSSKVEQEKYFILFDKEWLDNWKRIVGYDILKEKCTTYKKSSNNRYLITGCRDKSIKVFDLEKRILIKNFDNQHSNDALGVKPIKYENGKTFLISYGEDNNMFLWDLE